MGIGVKIKEARLNLGLTQEQLANLIGVKKSAVANYENDISSPREEILYKLFKALNVDANYIFEGQYTVKEGIEEKIAGLSLEARQELDSFVDWLKEKYRKD